jgi:hypothetical protein
LRNFAANFIELYCTLLHAPCFADPIVISYRAMNSTAAKLCSVVVYASLAVSLPCVCSAQIEIQEGTKIKVRLEQQLSSATADEGQPVQFAVTDDIKVGDVVAIKSQSVVNGTVIQSVRKRRMGRTGKLDFSIDEIIAPDGGKIPLRYSLVKKEGGSHAVRTGVITAGVAVLFWPAAPFVLLAHGKDTVFNKGTTYEVFTDAKYTVKVKEDSPSGPGTKASVIITSEPTGADISIDGAFVGNTPSTMQVAPGLHAVKVTKGSLVWERSVSVQSGSTQNVTAVLAEAAKSLDDKAKP